MSTRRYGAASRSGSGCAAQHCGRLSTIDLRRIDAARGERRRDRLGPELGEPAVQFG